MEMICWKMEVVEGTAASWTWRWSSSYWSRDYGSNSGNLRKMVGGWLRKKQIW
jgi:hypothetical protein